MAGVCVHGHPLVDETNTCEEGHFAAPPAAPAAPPAASVAELQAIIQQMLVLQNNSLQQSQLASNATAAAAPSTRTNNRNRAKPDRPAIKQNCTDGEWQLFVDSWRRYKSMCQLSELPDIRNELRCACSLEVNKLLFDIIGPTILDACTEDDLLKHIKSIAVQGSHKEVHRQTFQALSQADGELVTNYLAKLKAQAHLCEFNVPCQNCQTSVSYSTDMVSAQLIAGLHNADHQARVLAEAATLTTLQSKFDKLVSLETTDQATRRLNMTVSPGGGPSVTNATTSNRNPPQRRDRSNSRQPARTNNQNNNSGGASATVHPCKGCGKTSHPDGKSMRRSDCPAFDKECDNCHIKGHFQRVCKKMVRQQSQSQPASVTATTEVPQQPAGAAQPSEANSVQFADVVSYLFVSQSADPSSVAQTTQHSETAHAIPHMEWNTSTLKFEKQAPLPPPLMTISIEVITDKNIVPVPLPLPQHFQAQPVTTTTLADSGAQTCSGDLKLLQALGCTPENLLPTTHGILGVTRTPLNILGILPVRVTSGECTTNQIMYFSQNTRGCLLSEKALIDLHILSEQFPSSTNTSSTMAVVSAKRSSTQAECGCPKRLPPPELPTEMPLSPTEANIPELELWIKTFFMFSAFNTCPHQPLPAMTGDLMGVTLKKDAQPHAVHCPIPIPLHWEDAVLKDLKKDIALGIIEPVPSTTPTKWCARAVYLLKKDGTPRRAVDMRHQNEATIRHHHHTPSPFQQVLKVPAHMWKSVLDAWNGYHSILLDPAVRDFFTFIIKWGRFRYLRCPQGYHGSGDIYTHHFDEITKNFDNKVRQIDDSCLWKKTIEEMFWHVMRYIHHCHSNGVIFNHKKFVFCKMELEFSGFLLTADGIKPSPRIVEAIQKFPTPKNLTGIRSWFGLVNQVSYAFAQTELMAPFRDLLKKNQKFYWDSSLEDLFQQTKRKIVAQIENGIKMFDCSKATCLSTDWCKNGIGFLLFQQTCRCEPIEGPHCGGGHWAVVFAGSRFTTSAESRYAPIEGEALAVVYGLYSSKIFILGCPKLIVSVDHKPLVKVLGNSSLEQIKNPRLQKFKEKAMMFEYQIKHTPGKVNVSADAASRYPVSSPSEDDSSIAQTESVEYSSIYSSLSHVADPAPTLDSDVELFTKNTTISVLCSSPQFSAITWARIKEAGAKDRECLDLTAIISNGFPVSKKDLPDHLKAFWAMREDLYTVEGIPIQNGRILIPRPLRAEVLEALHSAHQGTTGMSAHAKQRFFWPGLDGAIRLTRAQCADCNGIAPSQSMEPFIEARTPEFPFECTATDIFHYQGHKFLMYVDRFTAWLEIALSPRTDATAITTHLRRWFTTFGVAVELASDGGPPFDSGAFKKFLKDWGVSHRLASAHFPQSNGRAELGVKSGKRLLMANIDATGSLDNDGVSRALLTYRNTPLQDSHLSPAQLLFGRKLKDHLPLVPQLEVMKEWKEIRQAREAIMAAKMADRMEVSNDTRKELPPLNPGQQVMIQDGEGKTPNKWHSAGVVTEVLPYRQYFVKVAGSNKLRLRNRQQLRILTPVRKEVVRPPPQTNIAVDITPRLPLPPMFTSTPTRHERVAPPNENPTWRMSPPQPIMDPPPTQNEPPPANITLPAPMNNTTPVTVPTIEPTITNDETIPYAIAPPTRQSTRTRKAVVRLSPKLSGKSHMTK